MENIIIKNQNKFKKIKNEIIKGGFKKLHIVSDFDRTLTKAFLENGEFVASLISILRDEDYLNNGYSQKAKELFNFYHNIEMDNSINYDKKVELMEQWWIKHSILLISSGLNKKDIINSSKSKRIIFREKTYDIFKLLDKKNVPIIVLSASGLGDESIIETFEYHKLNFSHVNVISNKYIWDDLGNAIDYYKPHIHALNKNENFIKNSEFYNEIINRKNVILLGDSLGDSNMLEGFEYDNLLKIGFLNYDIDKNLEEYKKHYDIVITGDGSLDFVYDLLKEI